MFIRRVMVYIIYVLQYNALMIVLCGIKQCIHCTIQNYFIFIFHFLTSKQQFGSNMTRTSSHGISFSSRIRPVGGSRSNMMASGSRWNVSTVESKSEKSVTHHKPAVQVLKCVFMLLIYCRPYPGGGLISYVNSNICFEYLKKNSIFI